MLVNWRIGNFKSVYEHTELKLSPLTIFVGTNSSGKSTFIQSMLIVAQTISNQVYARPIVLNGHITRLGNFDDLASKGSANREIRFGFKMEHSNELGLPHLLGLRASNQEFRLPFIYFDSQDPSSVDCDFSVAASDESISKELQQLQPQLVRCRLEVTSNESPEAPVRIVIEKAAKTIDERRKDFSISPEHRDADGLATLKYRVLEPTIYPESGHPWNEFEIPRHSTVVGCKLSHFVPVSLSVSYDGIYEMAHQKLVQLSRFQFDGLASDDNDPLLNNKAFLVRVLQIIRESLPDLLAPSNPRESHTPTQNVIPGLRVRVDSRRDPVIVRKQVLDDAVREFETQPAWTRLLRILRAISSRAAQMAFRTSMAEHFDELISLVRGEQQPVILMRSLPLPGPAREVSSFLQVFFAEFFKYLGPLRDEPKAFYPLEGAINPSDVGLKGEYTAAVLDLHKNAIVSYIPSVCFVNEGSTLKPVETTLQKAVIDWLKYMGVVSEVQTNDKGIFGHELKVATDSASLHNLTHVGVGVSQILPILVMSLLAKPGSVLLFEQPEIHLHPKVQTLLADFLLSVSFNKKQCIVETHSEYLINRIRYRAVIDKSPSLLGLTKLYFVEKKEGHSSYLDVKINEFGAIPDWPDGFFDESQREVERILLAAMQKRQSFRRR